MKQSEIEQLLIEKAMAGHVVARLKGGDPFIFGRGGEEALALTAAGIDYEVIPGVSSVYSAPAYAGIPITHRGKASSFHVITGHEDGNKTSSALDYQTRLTVSADIAAMIRKAEKSVILITRDLAEAISLADRVLILSARPARVKAEFPIHLTAADHSPLAARRAPEYGQLFNQIWEELSNENN